MNSAVKRIENDLKEILADDCNEFIVSINQLVDNQLIVHALAIGKKSSPFEDYIFEMTIQFPDDYPYSRPKVTMVANINDGTDRILEDLLEDLLKNKWKPTFTTGLILNLMSYLLHA